MSTHPLCGPHRLVRVIPGIVALAITIGCSQRVVAPGAAVPVDARAAAASAAAGEAGRRLDHSSLDRNDLLPEAGPSRLAVAPYEP